MAISVFAFGLQGHGDDPMVSTPEQRQIEVGERLERGEYHIITHPGRYGLGPNVPGSIYAVSGGRLIRMDERTGQVLSIIRMVNGVLD
ncbi:MAG: hypothetical protein Q4G36_07500 [Paracoccus sp. (in: a-proteobacteria)]|nr:hypothetical protein [Paracoccus sp. (in: a-proteobacteria)]